MKRTCATCGWWEDYYWGRWGFDDNGNERIMNWDNPTAGLCTKGAPSGDMLAKDSLSKGFPVTDAITSCGDWKPNDT